ncbi:hypothetical protein ACS0TY_006464 [Phlomoides rotata]
MLKARDQFKVAAGDFFRISGETPFRQLFSTLASASSTVYSKIQEGFMHPVAFITLLRENLSGCIDILRP